MKRLLLAGALFFVPFSGLMAQQEAESLYRIGREQLANGDLSAAESTFSELLISHPTSERTLDAGYWLAFALYRRGERGDLARAAVLLREPNPGSAHRDAAALALRIDALLGNPVESIPTCSADNGPTFAAAIQAAGRNAAVAGPPARRALLNQNCAVIGRRSALIVLGQIGGETNLAVLRTAATDDNDSQVRVEALSWLRGDPSRITLELMLEVLANSESTSEAFAAAAALSTLTHSDVGTVIYRLLRDTTVSINRRQSVISWSSRPGHFRISVDTLRALFEDHSGQGSIGSTILESVYTHGDRGDHGWIWQQVLSDDIPTLARLTGLQRLGSSHSTRELHSLYRTAPTRLIRYGVLEQLRGHPDDDAERVLREIIESEPAGVMRSSAEAALRGR